MKKLNYIGTKQKFIDAEEKVTGRAKFLDDIVLPNMLYAKILRSPYPHAKILKIDTSKAKNIAGVKAVITSSDCPKNRFGLEIADVNILAINKVRYVGDEVAAVAAESQKIAEEAVKMIDVKYEKLPYVTNVESALAPGGPLIHEDKPGNIAKKYHIERGKIDEDFKKCDYIFTEKFSTHRVQGCYMEPLGMIALWEENKNLKIWTGLQSSFQGRSEIAKALGVNPSDIIIIAPYIGGGFGAKIWIRNFHPIVALLSKETKRPVKFVLTREEEFLTTRPRVAAKMEIKLGMMADGTLICKESKILADNGAYSWAAPKVLLNMSMRTDCLYRFKSSRTESTLVYTNLVPSSGFRGYGNTQMHFALESMIDICARKIGIDPIVIRLKNAVRQGDLTLHGWKLRSCGLEECIKKAYKSIKEDLLPREDREGRIKRGIGLACMTHVSGNRSNNKFDGSSAMVRFHEDGKLIIYSGESDMGQGAKTVFAQIAAETMGISINNIIIMPIDTNVSPFCLGSYSSRVTTVGGKAVYIATQKLKEQLLSLAGKIMELDPKILEIKSGKIYSKLKPKNFLLVKDVCRMAIRTNYSIPLAVYITYDPPTVGTDTNYYGDYSSAYTYAAQAVEVEVDTETGQVKVLRIVSAHDIGSVINLNGVYGQIYGGISQGIGWTLYENQVYKEGVLQNTSFSNYIIMTIKDMPKIKPIIIETKDPIGPYGAKGIGEPTLIPTAPAIANAIQNAVGARVKDLPITPEKLYWAIHSNIKGGN